MIAAFIVSLYLLFIFLAWLFYFQHKRQEKMVEREILISKWCETLMDNQKVLSQDLIKLNHELQAYKKEEDKREVRRDYRTKEA